MFVDFSKLTPEARIWLYQAQREINEEQQQQLLEDMKKFIATWQAHRIVLYASANILNNRFLVIGLDESTGKASGCGIDDLVEVIKASGKKMGLDFFQNSKIAFSKDGEIEYVDFKEVKSKIQTGEINPQTPVFDLSAQTKKEIENWPKPAQDTWLARFFMVVLFLLIGAAGLYAQKQHFKNLTIHVGNGQIIENGFLSIENNKITNVGQGNPQESDGIDMGGAHLYPGLILLNNTLGIREIDAVAATLDYREVGELNPNISTHVAFNDKSDIIPTLRQNGVLFVEVAPRGELFAGQSSVFCLKQEKGIVKKDIAQHLYWKSEKINEVVSILNSAKTETNPTKNLKISVLRSLFDGSQILFLHCEQNEEAIKAIGILQELGIKKIVLVAGQQVDKIAHWLKDKEIAVVLPRVFGLPQNRESVEGVFGLAAKLVSAGVLCALNYEGDMEAMGARNLPFSAGQTVAYGLSQEQALSLISSNPAKILGLDHQIGTIEVGKTASFFISKGDALDITTNNLQMVYVEGKKIEISSRQIDLYKKYKR